MLYKPATVSNLSKQGKKFYMLSWDSKTRKQYKVYLDKWLIFCDKRNYNPYNCELWQGIDFLIFIFEQNYAYSSINCARSALSHALPKFEGETFGSHHITTRIMRAFYRERPQLSRYQSTWDVTVVLDMFRRWKSNSKLSRKNLSLKVVMLLLLTSCQRVQTLSTLKVSDLNWDDDYKHAIFRLSSMLKHSKRGTLGLLKFHSFTENKKLCPVRALKSYLVRTNGFRNGQDGLFLSYVAPFRMVSKPTLARWVRTCMAKAGINTTAYKAHSTRGAATSLLANLNIPVRQIMEKASWKCEGTFRKFYQKTVIETEDVSHAILRN